MKRVAQHLCFWIWIRESTCESCLGSSEVLQDEVDGRRQPIDPLKSRRSSKQGSSLVILQDEIYSGQ